MRLMQDYNIECYEYNQEVQFTCEFWINNFEFEIFFDLGRRLSPPESVIDDKLIDTIENYKTHDEGGGLNIDDLPIEMLSRIFSFCSAVDLLAVQAVCPHWREIVQADQGLWNQAFFSATDLDVKTTASLLKEMPLLRCVELCNIHSSDDMTFLISALCDACWQLHKVKFPENCEWHPSTQDLHKLGYFHPRITTLQICTKKKLTPDELGGIGVELASFPFLVSLKLVGFYWHQSELIPNILSHVEHLKVLHLPSVPGLSGQELLELGRSQPILECFTLNTSSLPGRSLKFQNFRKLKDLKIIDNSILNPEKVSAIKIIPFITSLTLNLSNCCKMEVVSMFSVVRLALSELSISNCSFSDELMACISVFCPTLRFVVWHNPKEAYGELTDTGLKALTKLSVLYSLEVKSRSVTKSHYPDLANMRSLHYARINGMRVPGCL